MVPLSAKRCTTERWRFSRDLGSGRALAYLLAALLLIGLGATFGVWQAAEHYRPQLDDANSLLVSCKGAQGNLETLTTEQGLKLGELVLAGNERQVRVEQAVKEATTQAQDDFAAANRLQQERTGGDQCAAAASIIDKELGL
ncbi:hypothetical protein [Pseudomonas alkylphenolica]|uniref:Uncharacterized protein n=1 Tax=Pseudomonas alkylphenolica TaxID=237609 RepID=A0A077F9P9_9PSED|nr:hypothetical protein [Pseudomonas alkylphenolica]AIL61185.1 hypothetical protein PSAKL28_19640 [Pseudomonas alkylphenolica]